MPCDVSVNEVIQEEKSYIHLGWFLSRVQKTLNHSRTIHINMIL